MTPCSDETFGFALAPVSHRSRRDRFNVLFQGDLPMYYVIDYDYDTDNWVTAERFADAHTALADAARMRKSGCRCSVINEQGITIVENPSS
jgi:hypothetical protein